MKLCNDCKGLSTSLAYNVYVKIKQHISEQPMDQRRNKKGNKNILRQMKMEIEHTQTYKMQ